MSFASSSAPARQRLPRVLEVLGEVVRGAARELDRERGVDVHLLQRRAGPASLIARQRARKARSVSSRWSTDVAGRVAGGARRGAAVARAGRAAAPRSSSTPASAAGSRSAGSGRTAAARDRAARPSARPRAAPRRAPRACRGPPRRARARPRSARTGTDVSSSARIASAPSRWTTSAGSRPGGSRTTRRSKPRRWWPSLKTPDRVLALRDRLLPGGVGVLAEQHLRREPLERVELALGQRGAHRADRLGDPGLAQRDHVGVALDEHEPPGARRRRAREVGAVDERALVEQLGLRRVEVLGLVVGRQRPRAEAEHVALRVGEREHDPPAEAVEQPAAPRAAARRGPPPAARPRCSRRRARRRSPDPTRAARSRRGTRAARPPRARARPGTRARAPPRRTPTARARSRRRCARAARAAARGARGARPRAGPRPRARARCRPARRAPPARRAKSSPSVSIANLKTSPPAPQPKQW